MYVTTHRLMRSLLTAILFASVVPIVGDAQTSRRTTTSHRNIATVDESGSLASLESLASLSDLASLRGLRGLRSLRSVEGLQGLARLSDLDAVLSEFSGLRALSGLADLSGLTGLSAMSGPASSGIDVREGPLAGDDQAADSLYRKAREALGNGDYRRAASLFQRIAAQYPKTKYAGDALYFRAFALYRAGDTGDLRSALLDLETLSDKYSSSSVQGDARTLRVRICGELARRGDERCAAEVEAVSAGGSASASASASRSSGTNRATSSQQSTRCPSEDDDDDERIAALNALLQMDADRALPILEKVLARRDACSVGLRRKAVFLVSQKGNEKAADLLLNTAKTDPDKEVRGQALFWLGQTRDERAVDMLEDVLKNSNDSELQDKAIFGLSQHHSDRANQVLRNLALNESMSSESREKAIFWLGQRSGGANATFLRELYDRLKSDQLKEKILFSASQQRSAEAAAWLLSVAQNDKESIDLRKNALFWAGQSKLVSLSDLGSMYDKIGDREMKEQVIFVLSQRRDTEAVDQLLNIAKNEKDRDLRKKAIFWLSQSKDPRVAKFLEDLISK